MGIKTTSFVTEMNQPLGSAVGNSVEVIEAIECLQGNGPADVLELVICQGWLFLGNFKNQLKLLVLFI